VVPDRCTADPKLLGDRRDCRSTREPLAHQRNAGFGQATIRPYRRLVFDLIQERDESVPKMVKVWAAVPAVADEGCRLVMLGTGFLCWRASPTETARTVNSKAPQAFPNMVTPTGLL